MKNMDKGLTASKWELINWQKIPQIPQKGNFDEKTLLSVPSPWKHCAPQLVEILF